MLGLRLVTAVLAGLFVATAGGSAAAHGLVETSDPKERTVVPDVPPEVVVTLSEAPAQGSQMRIRDGCGRNVAADVGVAGSDIVAAVDAGRAEPGPWRVTLRAISSVDGHPSRAAFGFRVQGARDCARGEGPVIEGPPDQATSSRSPIESQERGGAPWLLLAGGTIVVVGLALLVRRRMG